MLDAKVEFIEQPFVKPLQISSGTITRITEARAEVRVCLDAVEATGCGSIYLSDLWAWPDTTRTHEERDAVLRGFCIEATRRLTEWCGEPAHPLELGMRLHCNATEHPILPALATAMCISPFDAALHDAVGQALLLPAFSFYEQDFPVPTADALFGGKSVVRAIRQLLHRPPQTSMPAWYLVSATDDLDDGSARWAGGRYSCFKIKVLAKDACNDAMRTAAVYRRALTSGVVRPRLSLDSNEGNLDPASVLDYLLALRSIDAQAFDALEYLEQPTGRDIQADAHDWRPVTRLKPILLDEGLTDLELLPLAREQGWSGLALKTCKGHSFALTAAAWAREQEMAVALQDLTNPGFSAIHAALFAAHVPTINGVELNSPQFTPAANAEWMPRLAGLFEPCAGRHILPPATTAGLGSTL